MLLFRFTKGKAFALKRDVHVKGPKSQTVRERKLLQIIQTLQLVFNSFNLFHSCSYIFYVLNQEPMATSANNILGSLSRAGRQEYLIKEQRS